MSDDGPRDAADAPVVRFAPFTEADFQAWLIQAIPSYALAHVEDGRWSLAESIDKSRQAHAELLPEGLATPGHTFMRVLEARSRREVGFLWWADVDVAGAVGAYVYGVEIDEAERRRGFARAAFVELDRVARARGLHSVSLHVFGQNHGARRLYESLGFEPISITMRKPLR